MASPRLTVEAPTFVPALGGLLAAVNVVDSPDPHVGNGVIFLSGPESGFAGFAPGLCEAPAEIVALADAEKEFTGFSQGEGEPFAVYKGVECWLDGADDYAAAARAALAAGESHAVEIAVETLLLNNGTTISGTAATVVEALALAEQWAGNNYNGLPIIHVGRYGATYLIAAQVVGPGLDGSLTTALGTPVVVGSGYSGDSSGVFEMWVTGQMTLWHGPTIVTSARDTSTNKGYALAERIWSAVVDQGVVGKIAVTSGGGI